MDLLILLTDFLLTVDRPEEALIYATRVMEIGENHFFETFEFAYAEELYATTMAVLGDIDEARKFNLDAKCRLEREIPNAQRFLDNITRNLNNIKDN